MNEAPPTTSPFGPLPESQLTDLPTGDIRLEAVPTEGRTIQRVVAPVRRGFTGVGRIGAYGRTYGRPYWRSGWRNWWNYGRYRYAYIGGYYYPYYWTGASWYPYTFYDAGIPYQPYFSYDGGSLVPGASIVNQPFGQPYAPPVSQPVVQPIAQGPTFQGQIPIQSQPFQGQFPTQGQLPSQGPDGQMQGFQGQMSPPNRGNTSGYTFPGWTGVNR